MKLGLILIGSLMSLQVLAQQQGGGDSAVYYSKEGQFSKFVLFSQQRFEDVKGMSHDDTAYISAAIDLGGNYYVLLQYDSALYYFLKASAGCRRRYGAGSWQYGRNLISVATTYMELGQYEEAGQRYQEARAVLAACDSASYRVNLALCLTQYAGYCITTGILNKAEELCVNACQIASRAPVDTSVYAASLEKLSWLYEKLGLYPKQEEIIMRIFELQRSARREGTVPYANALASVAGLEQRHHHLEKADSMYRKALGIKRRIFGEKAAANIAVLNHVGLVNIELRLYREAEKYLREAADIVSAKVGERSPMYAYCVKNLARLYVLSGRRALAEPLFQRCLAIYDETGLTYNTGRINLLHDMADLLYANDPAKGAVYLQEAIGTECKLLLQKLDFLSEMELMAYLKRSKDFAESPYRFLMRSIDPGVVCAAYDSRLLAGGIGLQNSRALYRNMAASKDSGLALLWQQYLQQKSYYTNLLITPAAQRNVNTDSVAGCLNVLEKDILRRSAEYRNMKERLATRWQDVRGHLQKDEAAVEFVRFNANADSGYYAAFVVRAQDSMPRFVALCSERSLISVMKRFPYKAAGGTRGGGRTGGPQDVTSALYRLIWQPLESYLGHCRTVYFSPDDMLHRVAFSAIPYPYGKGMLLCDRYNLIQLTSTRQVALQETRLPAPVSIAMFGGINYNRQSVDTGYRLYAHVYQGSRGMERDSFPFLPNTLEEINAIRTGAEALQKRLMVFTADDATEAAVRGLGGDRSPEVIHFATHGFTLADKNEDGGRAGAAFRASYDPLLRCGLVMAGGNNGWKGKAGLSEDDGILTGLEISSIQLPNTELAVLSACETGLGKIEGSEGVFGLQRAFKLAGVNYVMASLWQVPDKETAEFMQIFYSQWFGGKSIRQAFFNTQQSMRRKYAPYYWAGFTLVQ